MRLLIFTEILYYYELFFLNNLRAKYDIYLNGMLLIFNFFTFIFSQVVGLLILILLSFTFEENIVYLL